MVKPSKLTPVERLGKRLRRWNDRRFGFSGAWYAAFLWRRFEDVARVLGADLSNDIDAPGGSSDG